MGTIRWATPDQEAALVRLWMAAFPQDTREDAVDFLRRIRVPEECLVCVERDEPMSMAFLLPAVLVMDKEEYPVQYIYAAATLPERRGQGLFGRLLTRAQELAAERGQTASCLYPASPRLAQYYARFGYHAFFEEVLVRLSPQELAVAAGQNSGDAWRPYDGAYAPLRDRLLRGHAAWVRWEERFASYAAKDGCILTCGDGCALCEPAGDLVRVRELLCPHEQVAGFYAALRREFPGSAVQLRRPVSSGEPAMNGGLLCPLTEKLRQQMGNKRALSPYLGLTLE